MASLRRSCFCSAYLMGMCVSLDGQCCCGQIARASLYWRRQIFGCLKKGGSCLILVALNAFEMPLTARRSGCDDRVFRFLNGARCQFVGRNLKLWRWNVQAEFPRVDMIGRVLRDDVTAKRCQCGEAGRRMRMRSLVVPHSSMWTALCLRGSIVNYDIQPSKHSSLDPVYWLH